MWSQTSKKYFCSKSCTDPLEQINWCGSEERMMGRGNYERVWMNHIPLWQGVNGPDPDFLHDLRKFYASTNNPLNLSQLNRTLPIKRRFLCGTNIQERALCQLKLWQINRATCKAANRSNFYDSYKAISQKVCLITTVGENFMKRSRIVPLKTFITLNTWPNKSHGIVSLYLFHKTNSKQDIKTNIYQFFINKILHLRVKFRNKKLLFYIFF